MFSSFLYFNSFQEPTGLSAASWWSMKSTHEDCKTDRCRVFLMAFLEAVYFVFSQWRLATSHRCVS